MRAIYYARVGFGVVVAIVVYGGIILSLLGLTNPGSPYLMFQ